MTNTKPKWQEIEEKNHASKERKYTYAHEEFSFEGVLMRATLVTDDCTMNEDFACKITTFVSSKYPPDVVCEAWGESQSFIKQTTYALKDCGVDPEDIEDKIGCTFLRWDYDEDLDEEYMGVLYKSTWNGIYYLKPMYITREIFEELSDMHLEKKSKVYGAKHLKRLEGFDHSLEYFVNTIEDLGGGY